MTLLSGMPRISPRWYGISEGTLEKQGYPKKNGIVGWTQSGNGLAGDLRRMMMEGKNEGKAGRKTHRTLSGQETRLPVLFHVPNLPCYPKESCRGIPAGQLQIFQKD